MTTYVDDQLGRLRDELRENGLEENTILIFMTDNGSSLSTNSRFYGDEGFDGFQARISQDPQLADWNFNSGLRGFKSQVYEGGHRVPLFIRAPGDSLGEARDVDRLSAHFDLLPTVMDIIGAAVPGDIDGVSLLPFIDSQETVVERNLVVTNQRVDIPSLDRPHVVMNDRWRYVTWKENGIEELFDITDDLGQETNVIQEYPDVADELKGSLQDWWQDAIAAGFGRQRIIVGEEAENPARLSAMDWMEATSADDVPWFPGFGTPQPELPHSGWLGRETAFGSLPWYIDVKTTGDYTIDLYMHDRPAATPVKRNYAILELNGKQIVQEISEWSPRAAFAVSLTAGSTEFKGWFTDDPEETRNAVPAFFAYVDLQ